MTARRSGAALAALAWVAWLGCSRPYSPPTVTLTDPVTGRTYATRAVLLAEGARDDAVTILSGAEVRAGEPAEFAFQFTAGSQGLPKGSTLLMVLPSTTWTPPQAKDPSSPGYASIEFPRASARCEIDVVPQGSARSPSRTRVEVFFRFVRGELRAGERAIVRYRASRVQAVAQMAPVGFYVDAARSARFAPIAEEPWIQVRPGDAVHVRLVCRSEVPVGAPSVCRAFALDRFGNLATDFAGEIGVTSEDPAIRFTDTARFARDSNGTATVYVVASAPGITLPRLHAGARNAPPLTFSAHPVRAVAGAGGPKPFWGDLQVHTGISDSFVRLSPGEALAYARHAAGVDFAAITDHAEGIWGDPMTDDDWTRTRLEVEGAFAIDQFAPLLGFVWTGAFPWDKDYPKGPGDWVVLYPGSAGSRVRADDPRSGSPARLHAKLAGTGAIAIPGRALPRGAADRWKDYDPRIDVAAEVYSSRGGSECATCGPPTDEGAADDAGSIQEALARGLRLGLVASSDNQGGHPGLTGYPGYQRLLLDAGGLTCVRAERLVPREIVDALRARRAYATTGARIFLDFSADGHAMGEEYARDEPGGPMFRIEVGGTGDLERVEIVKYADGLARPFPVVFTARPATWRYAGEFTDPAFDKNSLYYLRVVQKDGERAWSSPIWVDRKPATASGQP